MSYPEACAALGAELKPGHKLEPPTARAEWEPQPERLPFAVWMEQAAAFVRECAGHVAAGPGLDALTGRGLTTASAAALGIGWNPVDRYDTRAAWGLPEEVNPDTGKPRKVWLPQGLVLPLRRKAGVVGLLIRRAGWKLEDTLPKFWQIKGSGNGCFVCGKPGLPVVLVESVLDAALCWQEGAGLVSAVALTGASKKPDAWTVDFLRAAPLVLVATDFDRAGAWGWWRQHFPQAVLWPCVDGKDPGEMLKAGLSVRAWLEAGLASCREKTPAATPAGAEPAGPELATVQAESALEVQELSCVTWHDTAFVTGGTWRGEWPSRPTVLDRLRAWSLLPELDPDGNLALGNLDHMAEPDRAGVLRWLDWGDRRERLLRELRAASRGSEPAGRVAA